MGRTVIIGGGAIGLSLAYHLARRGANDVVLLERNQLTSGTSWHAAGIVGPLRATPNMTQLAMYAVELFPKLEAETGMSTGYKRTGGCWLARRPERMDELKRIASLGRHFGLNPEIVAPEVVAEAVPGLNISEHAGAMAIAEDANVNPVDLCMAYARAAKNGGVEIRENVAVERILTEGNRVTGVALADGSVIEADQVAICAGAWSKPFAETAGLALPLQAVEHMYVVTEPMPDLPDPFPVLRDMDTGIYIKGDAGKIVIGGFEPDAKCWDAFGPEGNRPFLEMPEDWDQFMPFMEAALDLMPALAEVGIQHFMNGPESFTNDTRPLVGEAPSVDGLFVAAGMNSVGIMSSAGIGRALADWMVDGSPPMDLWEVDIARADPAAAEQGHMEARMEEAVSDLMGMHWPYKQPNAGRGLRKSALHDQWAAKGAVFGLTGGWERGLWYALNEEEKALPYSVGDQTWWPIVAREAAVMETGVALLDLSPFGKFDVTGPDALTFLEQLCTAKIDRPNGRAIYTLALNVTGGIELDATVTRFCTQSFRITSGAATRWRDMALLRRRSKYFDVAIADVTEKEAVIGVMGAGSRALLNGLSSDDWKAFPFSTCREVEVASVKCRATRMSFVGELGWELSVPVAKAVAVFDALTNAGAKPLGHYALDGCRLEKGFKHWGHDLGPEVTPLEAGLGFAINWDKDFTGKPALQGERDGGIARRLCLFDVSGDPLMLHDELIIEEGQVVGLTTSGGRGARTGKTLAFGLIGVGANESLADTCARNFEIEVAGKRYPAQALLQPPFDPKSERMRG
ncbi:4-methylaminobutanoate oxidase (formaldehyde-forming) [Roseovarius albus]|uniref:4-methylaminobutanoate oxidase (Formaldehyde-forming) n=1 Tax=Roseovarius albus TaxID=1247867 RepID=A0A1X6YFF4_9RHOB|nr:FAD-dependent oxidoreductase [Roseovarius albus]SLN18980.1 4-methylaminobutanoate oxidase (formaldehyde-forming) [Roseovarius albus]